MADTARPDANRFLFLYALAWSGGTIAYFPFLTIILPVRVHELAGTGADVRWLAVITFSGAIAASLANLVFGWLSDITARRRPWIGAGLALSCALLVAVGRVSTLGPLVGLIVAWQVCVNMMLAPLSAWAGDKVPDDRKGLLGGLLAFSPGLSALSGALVTLPGLAPGFAAVDGRLRLVALLVLVCVLPALIAGREGGNCAPDVDAAPPVPRPRGPAVRMWFARLAIQISEAALFSYLYIWFRSVDPAMTDHRTAQVLSVVMILSAPCALMLGAWADRARRPFAPLLGCAAAAAAGLLAMGLAPGIGGAIISYAVFGTANAIFLSLHSAQTLRVLPRSTRRGRDLGLFNLTNTVPSLIMPGLTLALVPRFGFSGLFMVFFALALVGCAILFPLRHSA